MNRAILCGVFLCHLLTGVCSFGQSISSNSFINFETAPVHPVGLSPDGRMLAVCNLADGRVELLNCEGETVVWVGSVPVGIDPVSVRFRNTNELWVVNQISDSVNIIDMAKRAVVALLDTEDAPSDVVFAGGQAFVSCAGANRVMVFDGESRSLIKAIEIEGDRPKGMAVSPEGDKVFVAIFESGNGSTILAPRFTGLGHFPPAGIVDMPLGPYGGLNPPPNSGTNFLPAFGTNLPAGSVAPRVGMIVKKQSDGRFLDDNNGDWTEFVTGTNAPFSGRGEDWELLDHDVAVIDVPRLSVSYVDSLMNICMDVAVDPKAGTLAVVGTDGINEVRFEPALQSIFTRAELGLIKTNESSGRVLDLNSHLDYKKRSIPVVEREKAVGDPRGVLWDQNGERLFVTGMGSDNLVVLDRSGQRIGEPLVLPAGPTGMALDAGKSRLFVFSRFAASVSVVDSEQISVLQTISIFDPTPESIKKGRPHFYNTHKSSGLGQAACASCHLDGRMDRLAWDLGTQLGAMKEITATNRNFGSINPAVTNHFHPMKGPMVTQTLQDIIGHEPFHWRGDRDGLEEFNPTFQDLQGADDQLSASEMREFKEFLGSISFPPNRFRNFDNTLPRNLPLKGFLALGRGSRFRGDPMPNGDASAGFTFFRSANATCTQCHTVPLGMGTGKTFLNGQWTAIPLGTNGESHVALSATERSGELPFKVPQLRNLADKVGANYLGKAQAGFGYFHDGRVDSLTRFLQDGFAMTDDQQTANLIAFLLSFSGGDLTAAVSPFNPSTPPGDPTRDPPAAFGKQLLLAGSNPRMEQFFTRASSPTGRLELVVKGLEEGRMRGWLWDSVGGQFLRDSESAIMSKADLIALATVDNPLLMTLVGKGTGRRIGIDRNENGTLDFDESGEDGNAALARQTLIRAQMTVEGVTARISWNAVGGNYRVVHSAEIGKQQWQPLDVSGVLKAGDGFVEFKIDSSVKGFYKIEVLP